MDVIICEDNYIQKTKIENIIKEEINRFNLDINITCSTFDPKRIIEYVSRIENKNSIYFLDVELNSELNGIQLARIIRKYDTSGYIVFVTAHAELVMLTFKYKVRAMDYIFKFDAKNLEPKICECLLEAYNNYKNSENTKKKYAFVDVGSKVVKLNFNKILFFETNKNHRIKIHTFDGEIEFYSSLREIEKLIPIYFYRVHRSYIVNIRNIKSIDKNKFIINMVNGERCYVSRRYMKDLLSTIRNSECN
ncbi:MULTISPECIES: LytR/AlgR family response regulator transcription factor [Clostridium]|uniref:LytR/AlgR family response regulator transcription factor n=1 Tax=Clostridium TaxID=1485 RepID=UPI0008266E89|nr:MULTISPECIES: LytTR family DNA-binding domain-containing protein [Clostridium]PJI07702.1 DNA-binding response regulator [Clostridium sp. CT7]